MLKDLAKLSDYQYQSGSALIRARFDCLSPESAVSFVRGSLEYDFLIRSKLAQKISMDIKDSAISEHNDLMTELFSLLDVSKYRARNRIAYFIKYWTPAFDARFQKIYTWKLIESPWTPVRRKGLRLIYKKLNEKQSTIILNSLKRKADIIGYRTLVKFAEIDFLRCHLDLLDSVLQGDYFHRILYRRLCESDFLYADRIRELDPMIYCYLYAKYKRVMTVRDARSIWDKNTDNLDRDLLIWCFGQMKLVEVLDYIEENQIKKRTRRCARVSALSP